MKLVCPSLQKIRTCGNSSSFPTKNTNHPQYNWRFKNSFLRSHTHTKRYLFSQRKNRSHFDEKAQQDNRPTMISSTATIRLSRSILSGRNGAALMNKSLSGLGWTIQTPALSQLVPNVLTNTASPMPQIQFYSTTERNLDKGTGFVERPLKALDMAVVRQIKSELMEVDVNSDGRYV